MNSQLLEMLQDVLDGKMEISPDIEQILEDEEIQKELQELLPSLNFSALPRPIELFPTSNFLVGASPVTSEDLLLASPVTSEKDSEEVEFAQIEKTETEKDTEILPGEATETATQSVVDVEQLEVIVRLSTRPVIYIQNDTFNIADPIVSQYLVDSVQKKLEKAQEVIQPAIKASGKIGVPNNPVLSYFGTGWLVADDIIVTNRHVARLFTTGQDDRKVSFQPGKEIYINFKAEHNNKDEAWFKIKSILYIQDVVSTKASIYPDIAFLRVSDRGVSSIPLPAPIPLSENPVEKDRDVVVIGYPGPLSDNDVVNLRRENPDIFYNIFQGVFGVKRLQPGQIQIDETKTDGRIAHDCTTLGGNSGSVVLDLETGKAVGLHFGGKYDFQDKNLNMNYAVPASTIKELLDKIL